MAPISTVTPFEPLLPSTATLPPRFVMQNTHKPLQYHWYLDLGPANPLAPIDIAAEWNTPAGLAFPSVDTPTTQAFNEGREVTVPQSESNYD